MTRRIQCDSDQRSRRWDDLGEELISDERRRCWRRALRKLRAPIGDVVVHVCGVHAQPLERAGWVDDRRLKPEQLAIADG